MRKEEVAYFHHSAYSHSELDEIRFEPSTITWCTAIELRKLIEHFALSLNTGNCFI